MLRVYETRRRSLLKGITHRIFEIAVDTFILSWFVELKTALGLAVLIELVCYIGYVLHERGWNRIHYGRIVYRGDR